MSDQVFAQADRALCALAAVGLARRWGLGRPNVPEFPEEKNQNQEAVELAVSLGSIRCYLEHTLIESYPGQRQNAVRLNKLFPEYLLAVSLPDAGHFRLTVPPDAGLKSKDVAVERQALARWVEEQAPRLPVLSPRTKLHARPEASLPDVPFSAALHRWTDDPVYAREPGVGVQVGWSPEQEATRVGRFCTALERKCPKLVAAASGDARTVLVLEDIDWSLSSMHIVSDTLLKAAGERPGVVLPSEVVVVEDFGAVTLKFHLLREASAWLDEASPLDLTSWDVHPARPVLRRRYG